MSTQWYLEKFKNPIKANPMDAVRFNNAVSDLYWINLFQRRKKCMFMKCNLGNVGGKSRHCNEENSWYWWSISLSLLGIFQLFQIQELTVCELWLRNKDMLLCLHFGERWDVKGCDLLMKFPRVKLYSAGGCLHQLPSLSSVNYPTLGDIKM